MAPAEGKKGRVVLVEDDSLLSGVLTNHLREEGFDVDLITDGRQVVEKVQSWKPDIVLLDIVLPGANGFDILGELKRGESTKSIPILILSNLGSKEEIKRGLDLGAAGYLVKANSLIEEITGKVEDIVSRHAGP
ncbi:response regulator [Candidatus Kaiserbacteria bacterium]|nr:response regulator [Candidatus Kaiserbacteria bacterium]